MTSSVESGSIREKLESRCFTLPEYQRTYSWNREQVDDFIKDIEYAIETDSEHYLGGIIVYSLEDESTNKIVDGQQRITTIMLLFSSVRELVEKQIRETEDDVLEQKLRVVEGKCKNMIENLDGEDNLTYSPDEKQKKTYINLVKKENNNPTLSDCNNPADKNLLLNKRTLKSWVESSFESMYAEAEDLEEYGEKVESMINSIRNNLTFTIYEVSDKLEANRMFEVVNDRGKSVNVADKVKSYLSYYTAVNDDSHMSERISQVFYNLRLNVAGDDVSNVSKRIDAFIDEHWRVFSGIENSTGVDVHSSIKQIIDRQSDYDRGKRFIDAYLTSLTENMEYYEYVKGDIEDILDEEDNECIKDNRSSLYVINKFGADSMMVSVTSILASYESADKELSDSLSELLETIEGLIINHYNLCERRADFNRTRVRESGIAIEWARRNEEASYIFNNEDEYSSGVFSYDKELDACIERRKNIERNLDESVVEKHLEDLDDCLNGDAGTGINKDVIKYVLFWYEVENFDDYYPRTNPVEDFEKRKSDYLTLEHVLPRKLDESYDMDDYNIENTSEHKRLRNNLGNLAILSLNNNISASNSPYYEKCQNDYEGRGVSRMIKDGVVDEYDEWNETNIDDRKEKLIEFVTNKWS